MFVWGAANVTSSTTTRYIPPGFYNTSGTTTPISLAVPRAGKLQHLFIHCGTAGGAGGKTITYTVYVNGVATALEVTMPEAGTDASDTTHSVTVNQGDLIDIVVTKSGTLGGSPNNIIITCEFGT